jgi:hypothetical protein
VTGLFFVLFDYLYNLIPADIQRRFGAELQDTINRLRRTHLKVDGYVGPVTVQAVSHELSK